MKEFPVKIDCVANDQFYISRNYQESGMDAQYLCKDGTWKSSCFTGWYNSFQEAIEMLQQVARQPQLVRSDSLTIGETFRIPGTTKNFDILTVIKITPEDKEWMTVRKPNVGYCLHPRSSMVERVG